MDIASAGSCASGWLAYGHTYSSAGPGTPFRDGPSGPDATTDGVCLSNTVSKRMPLRGPFVPASGEPLSYAVCHKSALISQPGRAVEGAGRMPFQGKEEPPMYTRFCVSDPVTVSQTFEELQRGIPSGILVATGDGESG